MKEKSESKGENMSIKKAIDHEGNEFPTITAMCRHWGITKDAYKKRIKRGWSLEDTLTIPVGLRINKKDKLIIDHKGNEFPSISAMCKHWNISFDAYRRRIKLGWTLKAALTVPVRYKSSKTITDHKGNTFPSVKEMIKYWNISRTAYESRIKRGWSLKDVLTTPVKSNLKVITDHENNKFSSTTEMCRYWGVKTKSYDKRIRSGWTKKDALTKPVNSKNSAKSIIDHEGNNFFSIEKMCQHWGVTRSAYDHRIKNGWSLKDALTIPIGSKNSNCKVITDHEGNKFPSLKEMCKHYGITKNAYVGRISLGWSKQKSLTTPVSSRSKIIVDHKGNAFPSIKEMCKHWGITRTVFDGRIRNGWLLKNALTIPVGLRINEKDKLIIDHKGNEFSSIEAMCKYWGVNKNTYNHRLACGWSLKETLTTILNNTEICDGYIILCLNKNCKESYLCKIKGLKEPIIRSYEDIFNDILQLRETKHIDWFDRIQKENKKNE